MQNPQAKDSWIKKRSGKITASRIGLVTRRKKDGKPYAGYQDYLMDLVTERLTDRATEHFVSDAMQWGIEQEDAAAQFYAFERGVEVAYSDFVDHEHIPMCGASPDRLVGTDGLLEIKCPNTRTHIDFFLSGEIPIDYQFQAQWQMECTNREWCDFMSYDPRLPIHLQSKIVRVYRDADRIQEARKAVLEALAIIDDTEARLRELELENAA